MKIRLNLLLKQADNEHAKMGVVMQDFKCMLNETINTNVDCQDCWNRKLRGVTLVLASRVICKKENGVRVTLEQYCYVQ